MKIIIDGEFATLNEYIGAERANKYAAASIKKDATKRVAFACIGLLPVEKYPIHVVFNWYWKNTRPDPDNIAFAKKYILDGFVESGLLAGDAWKHTSGGFEDNFFTDAENPRVEVVIT